MSLETVACDLCGSDSADLVTLARDFWAEDRPTYSVVRCRRCELVFTNPRPPADDLSHHYPDAYVPFVPLGGVAGIVDSLRARREERRLRALLGRPGRVLEIGCGIGSRLRALRARGWEATGVEPDPVAAHLARDRGLEVVGRTVDEVDLPEGAFDVVLMRHVLEHVPSPQRTLLAVHRWLVPDGHLLLALPNFDSLERVVLGSYWHGYEVPRHLYHFTPRTLRALLGRTGYDLCSLRQSVVPNSWIWSARYWLMEHGWSRLGRRVTPRSAACVALALPLGVLGALAGRAGRIEVDAVRKGAGREM